MAGRTRTKKLTKSKAARADEAAAHASTRSGSATRCEAGDNEMLPGRIPVEAADTVKLDLTLCKSPFRVVVHLDQTKIANEVATDSFSMLVGPLEPGLRLLHWAYLPAAPTWQIKSRVIVNGIVRFRKRKSDESEQPDRSAFVYLDVR